jgi:hypothetical protein
MEMERPLAESWAGLVAAFAPDSPVDQQLAYFVGYAVWAPSVRNTQPWRFVVREGHIRLYADTAQTLGPADPVGREVIISCGAALFYLRLAMRVCGYQPQVTLCPDPADPARLADIALGGRRPPTAAEQAVFAALPTRHTTHAAFLPEPLPTEVLTAIESAVVQEGAWLELVAAPGRRAALAALIEEADHTLWADPAFRQALAPWVRPNNPPAAAVLPWAPLGIGVHRAEFAPLLVRTLDLGTRQAERDQALSASAARLAVLGTPGDEPIHWLRAGQALAHGLGRAAAAGVAAGFFTSPLEVATLRPVVGYLAQQAGAPQVILGLGYAPLAVPTHRLPLSEVLQ